MKVKCDYCENLYEDSLSNCPSCGASNVNVIRTNNSTPKTIEELAKWFSDNNYTSDKTRFFIGVNYKKPKAFGIYKDESTDDFVVYKNKADGSRAIRYQGKDEEYAVNEIWLRFQSEVINQKNIWLNKKNGTTTKYNKVIDKARNRIAIIFGIIMSFFPVICVLFIFMLEHTVETISHEYDGYYSCDGELYYCFTEYSIYKYDKLDKYEDTDNGWYKVQYVPDGISFRKDVPEYKKLPEELRWLGDTDRDVKEYRDEWLQYRVEDTGNIDFDYYPFEDTYTYAELTRKKVVDNGYYKYNDDLYYSYNGSAYKYDDYNNDWETDSSVDSYNKDFFYEATDLDWDSYVAENGFEYDVSAFEDTDTYQEISHESISYDDDDWDNDSWDSDWSSSDWDSGSTDWDSDW